MMHLTTLEDIEANRRKDREHQTDRACPTCGHPLTYMPAEVDRQTGKTIYYANLHCDECGGDFGLNQ